eukprot:m.155784 g.155784  ORF g.155784 m.155784 type:complete len:96 (-) comp52916_c2_seq2:4-291(-)
MVLLLQLHHEGCLQELIDWIAESEALDSAKLLLSQLQQILLLSLLQFLQKEVDLLNVAVVVIEFLLSGSESLKVVVVRIIVSWVTSASKSNWFEG